MCSVYAHFEKNSSKLNFHLIYVSVLTCFLHDVWWLEHHTSALLNEKMTRHYIHM
jgi:hypothetical protein